MDLANYSSFTELNLSRDDYTLKVRIVRLWRQPMFKNPSQTYSIEMILVDEEGNKVQASVLHKWFSRFERFLSEMSTLIIKKPTIGDNSANFKYVDNPFKVCLYYNTSITKCNDFNGPLYGFSFIDFQSIMDRTVSESGSIDVIGLVVKYYKIEDIITKNGKQAFKLNFHMQDLEGLKISVTLWDDYAKELYDYLLKNPEARNVVIILQFGKFKNFREGYSVSNSYSVSRLFINSEIHEIMSFKESYLAKCNGDESLTVGIPSSSMLVNLKDDFLNKTEFNSIAEVNEIVQVKSVVVVGIVKMIVPDVEWFYQSCKFCTRKVVRDDSKDTVVAISSSVDVPVLYKCPSDPCKDRLIDVVPRFKIPIRVQDPTGIVSLTVFDREAKKYLKQNASNLFEDYIQGVGMSVYPDVFNTLLDRKFAFKIDITTYNVENNYKFFGVSKMTDDPVLISEIEKKYNLEQGPASYSLNLSAEDYKSQDTNNYKESMSFTGETTTPVSYLNSRVSKEKCENEDADNFDNTPNSLKRNLIEVYDVEEIGSSSGSKTLKQVSGAMKADNQPLLITPKIEK